jgi:predicted DNA-binding protein YlxM (UPF0122 family)
MTWGSKQMRVTRAIHDRYLTDKSVSDIADDLDVTENTVHEYLTEPPVEEVKEAMTTQSIRVRMLAVEELQQQLQAVGVRSRSAEKPVKVYTDDNGDLTVQDATNEDGDVVDKFAVPDDVELGPDHEERYYAREEVREILDQLTELVGAAEPEEIQIEHTGETENVGELRDAIESLRNSEDD